MILPTIYPSADLPSIFIKHLTNKVKTLRAIIASEHVTSTLVTGTTAASFFSFEKVSQLTVKECIHNSAPNSCDLHPVPSKHLIECLDRTHYVSLSSHCSAFAYVHSGVPQGSVHGPILFNMYIKPSSAIIDSHSIIDHSFADDLQLLMSAPPDKIAELLHSVQSCINVVKEWASDYMLKLNDNKTELMLVTSKRDKHLHNLPTSITIGNAQIPFKHYVKNLGLTLDCHLTMHMSPILLGHATLNCVVWHLFVDS